MQAKKKTPRKVKGCEYCVYRTSDFFQDTEEETITRCYCNARHVNVDAELMTLHCDFFELNKSYAPPKKEETGL